jgi:hypothetical protein
MMQQNQNTAQQVDWEKFGKLSGQRLGLKEEGLMLSHAEMMKRQKAAGEMQASLDAQKARQSQSELGEKEFLIKALEQTVEGSTTSLTLLRQVLKVSGALNSEIDTAITNELKVRGHLDSGQLSETEQAHMEATRAAATNTGRTQA